MISTNRLIINNNWGFKKSKNETLERVDLPHTNHIVPYNYFNEKDYQFISYYEKKIILKNPDKRYILSFEGIMTAFHLLVDGEDLGEYKGGYLPHRIELPGFHGDPKTIHLEVVVDSTEREEIPPFGNIVDYLAFGGIYRDVYLYELESTFLSDAAIRYEVSSIEGETGTVCVTPVVEIDSLKQGTPICLKLQLAGQEHLCEAVTLGGVQTIQFPTFACEEMLLWHTDAPHLYDCHIVLEEAGCVLDEADIRLGFRKIDFSADGMFLNDRPFKIFGLNRHQSFPYAGYAMPKRAQEQDALILKRELGVNTVRTSHYPQSPYFLDQCDELGLLVLEEIPGWQYVSQKEEWRSLVVRDTKGMIKRDINHPSIFAWGVRINESRDDHALYEETNRAAKELDPTRPTTGSRCIERSELLEDFYSMNDFMHGSSQNNGNILRKQTRCTGLEEKVPYLVTECVGHMFPTKRFDQEQRLIEHALMHGRIQSMAAQYPEYMGAIAWCAFDYYTHFDFGSGDRICYHGVMDMFRIPKFAAAVYKSQKKPKDEYVLEPLTYWTRGERNGGNVFPIHVFTNCPVIEIKMGGVSKGRMERQFFNTDPNMQFLDYPP
ncbi:MAG: glycoside hydrolase family 2 TIM barrel-domain containing protein, partial [Hungatella sp.]